MKMFETPKSPMQFDKSVESTSKSSKSDTTTFNLF